MSARHVRWAVTASAVFLAGLGAALLFAGREVGAAVFGRPDVEPLASVLGGALLGFAAMNWTARSSTLGGIYGRAVVVGNQTHFVIGALVLLRQAAAGGPAAVWVLAAFYALGAALFVRLLLGAGLARE